MKLGEPYRVDGSVRVSFRGEGPARFRLQHTGDDGTGRPDDLGWCDVSDIASQPDPVVTHGMIRAMMVSAVRGDVDIDYHRYRADWIRVVPQDEDETEPCQRYSIDVQPLNGRSSKSPPENR